VSAERQIFRKYLPPKRLSPDEHGALPDLRRAYFSRASGFNDPKDVRLWVSRPDNSVFENDDHLSEVVKSMAQRPSEIQKEVFFSGGIRAAFQSATTNPNFVEDFRNLCIERFNECGIYCLFHGGDSAAMWAYYAGNATGCCIEYEAEGPLALQGANPELFICNVQYADPLPSVSVEELIFSPKSACRTMVATKHVDWSHERELRIVDFDQSGSRDLPKGICIKRVIAGVDIDDAHKQNLTEMCQKAGVSLWLNTKKFGCVPANSQIAQLI